MDELFSNSIQNWGIISTFIGLAISTISLGLSIWVLINTYSLKRSFLKKATIPSINANIQEQLKKLDKVVTRKPIKIEDANKIKSLIFGSLKHAKDKLSPQELKEVDNLIKNFNDQISNEQECHRFHLALTEISSYLIETQKASILE